MIKAIPLLPIIFRNQSEREFWSDVFQEAMEDGARENAADHADGCLRMLRERMSVPGCARCDEPLEESQHWVITGGLGAVRICPTCCASLKVELNPTKPPRAGTN